MRKFTVLVTALFVFIIWTKGGSMIRTDKIIFEAPPSKILRNVVKNTDWIKVRVYNTKNNCVYYPISNIAFIEEEED